MLKVGVSLRFAELAWYYVGKFDETALKVMLKVTRRPVVKFLLDRSRRAHDFNLLGPDKIQIGSDLRCTYTDLPERPRFCPAVP